MNPPDDIVAKAQRLAKDRPRCVVWIVHNRHGWRARHSRTDAQLTLDKALYGNVWLVNWPKS